MISLVRRWRAFREIKLMGDTAYTILELGLHANTQQVTLITTGRLDAVLITVEALRSNPAYARARQKYEQELAHAEKVIKTIKEEGFWDGRVHNQRSLKA